MLNVFRTFVSACCWSRNKFVLQVKYEYENIIIAFSCSYFRRLATHKMCVSDGLELMRLRTDGKDASCPCNHQCLSWGNLMPTLSEYWGGGERRRRNFLQPLELFNQSCSGRRALQLSLVLELSGWNLQTFSHS